jgi:hypothetical protein
MRITPLLAIGITILILTSTTPFTAELINQSSQSHTYTLTSSLEEFTFSKLEIYDIVSLIDGALLTEPGQPMIPYKNIYITLPSDQIIQEFKITTITTEPIPGTYTIIPTQPAQPLSKTHTPTLNQITPSYYQNSRYPTQWIQYERQISQSDQNLAHFSVYPLTYNPYTKQLKFASCITFTIQTTINNHEIEYQSSAIPNLPKTIGVPPGTYDYVIITSSAYSSTFQPLANWKTQKGVPANIVNLTWIYNSGGYSGTNKEKIRAFIQDAHSTWGTTYFLLGGDTNTIPYHTVNYNGDSIPTDAYYGDYDNDWTYEVMIGRASVVNTGSGAGGIQNFVNKILTYEKNPPTTDYTKRIGLFGFDLDSTTDGEDCKIDIDNDYIPSGWSVTTVYDSQGGNHEDNVDTAVNAGQHLINHIDHCNEYYIGTGSTNHDWGLTPSEIDAFVNGNKQSIFYSIGCWASAFDFDNCIAEHFVRDTDGGGVAFVGNTRYGWYYVGYDDLASLRYDRYFFRSLFIQDHYILGDLFVDHKQDAYNSMTGNDLNKYIFSELNLLGDPEMPLWTDNPTTLTVTYPTTIPLSSSSFPVQVTNGGSNLQDATVCLWKGTDIYEISTTDATGQATFTLDPTTPGQLLVTVTKHNYLPYEGISTVVSNNQPPLAEAGGPYTGTAGQSIQLDGSASYDPDGVIILFEWDFDNDGTYDWSSPTTGVTNHTYTTGGAYIARIRVTDNQTAQANDTATVTIQNPNNNPPYLPTTPQPPNGQTDVTIAPTLSWTGGDPDPGDIVTYDVYFGTTNPPPLITSNQTDITYTPGTLNIQTTYYWQIYSWDNHGAMTEGPIWSFTTKNSSNTAPNKPIISGKNQGQAGTPYTYTFVCNDPEDDDLYLYVDWGDDSNSGWLGPYQSGHEINIPHTWNDIGSYIVRAKAKDIHNAEGEWERFPITMPQQTINSQRPLLNLIQIILARYPLIHQLLFILLY